MAYIYSEVWNTFTNAVEPSIIKMEEEGGDGSVATFIPNDPSNAHWQEYQRWLEEGNTPIPAKAPIVPKQPSTEI